MKITSEITGNIVQVTEMSDGDIAIIEKWSNQKHYVGRVVQRYDNSLISLGLPQGKSWFELFRTKFEKDDDQFMVRILPAGTVMEI